MGFRFHFSLLLCLALWLSVITLVPATAWAQEQQAAKASSVERARALYEEGVRAYSRGELEVAVLYFERAEEIFADPIFPYNIAVCLARLGEPEAGLEAALRAEVGQLPPDVAAKNSARIVAFRRVLRTREQSTLVTRVDVDAVSPGWGPWDTGAVALGGIGISAAALALWYDGRVGTHRTEFERAVELQDDDAARAAESTGREMQRNGQIAGVVSIFALAASGSILISRHLFKVGQVDRERTALMLWPVINGAGAGIAVTRPW